MAKPTTSSGKGNEQIKKEDVKQAVIVDYKALGTKCPGGATNTKPFIQYSLEWLLIEQIDEIFVCCLPENVQQIRAFVKNFTRIENVPSSMTIHVHSSESNMSTGDCLRDLDAKALIKSDFVIMDVGCCGNLPLAELLDAHKALKKIDKDVIMTSICRNVFSKNPAEIGEFPIYVTDPTSGHLLHYVAGRVSETGQGSRMEGSQKESVEVPSKIFLERDSVKIHTNLCSTNLSIYSANVPARFTELFDHHSEADLIQAAFDNEYLGGTVYVQVIDDLFSQRMADFGFAINQKWDQFDTNLIYKRNHRYQVLRKLVNDSLIDCTRLNTEDYLSSLKSDDEESVASDTDSEVSVLEDDVIFLREVLESLVRGFEETIENENLKLEVNSSKHAYNISISDVVATIARALLILPEKLTDKPKSILEYSNLVDKSIMKFRQFLLNYIKNSESRQTAITTMEEIYYSNQIEFLNDTVLAKVFYKLYEIDALDEDSLLEWFKDFDKDDHLQKDLRARPAMKQLIEALEADSEEEDEDEDVGDNEMDSDGDDDD